MREQQLRGNEEIYRKLAEREQKCGVLAQEVERFNEVVAKQMFQLEDRGKLVRFLEEKNINYEKMLQAKNREIYVKEQEWLEGSKRFEDKDLKIQTLAREIGRLNMVLDDKLK